MLGSPVGSRHMPITKDMNLTNQWQHQSARLYTKHTPNAAIKNGGDSLLLIKMVLIMLLQAQLMS
jgi:hypothetical protein